MENEKIRQQLKIIEGPSAVKEIGEYVERIFDDELLSFANDSYHSKYHEHVKVYGYPIPDTLKSDKFYFKRKALENSLKEKIIQHKNVIVLGCEGSGKTTLIHRIVGFGDFKSKFFYVDASDIHLDDENSNSYLAARKILMSIFSSLSEENQTEFDQWTNDVSSKNEIYSRVFSTDKDEGVIENFFVWMSLVDQQPFYIVIDNIDSISIESAESFFKFLNRTRENVVLKARKLSNNGQTVEENLRFITTCRAPTYSYITSASAGLFIGGNFELVQAENDLKNSISIPRLLQNFIVNENSERYIEYKGRTPHVQLRPYIGEVLTFDAYVNLVCRWLDKPPHRFDRTIKWFTGRSIRRMKLYGLKVISSPVIARLAAMEEREITQNRTKRTDYIKRRTLEALFDFSIVGRVSETLSAGFPLNPFRISDNEGTFSSNPLIGVVGLRLLATKLEDYIADDMIIAKSIDTYPLLETLKKIGYSDDGVFDFFNKMMLSGLLRPIRSSKILMASRDDHNIIYQFHVIDEHALANYSALVFCEGDTDASMQFYNGSVRAHYGLGYLREIDNFLYECFLALVFLHNVIIREEKLRGMARGSGILVEGYTGLIRAPLLTKIESGLRKTQSQENENLRAGKKSRHEELSRSAWSLFREVKIQLSDMGSFL